MKQFTFLISVVTFIIIFCNSKSKIEVTIKDTIATVTTAETS